MILNWVTPPHNANLATGQVASRIERNMASVSDSQAGLKGHVPFRNPSPIYHFPHRPFCLHCIIYHFVSRALSTIAPSALSTISPQAHYLPCRPQSIIYQFAPRAIHYFAPRTLHLQSSICHFGLRSSFTAITNPKLVP